MIYLSPLFSSVEAKLDAMRTRVLFVMMSKHDTNFHIPYRRVEELNTELLFSVESSYFLNSVVLPTAGKYIHPLILTQTFLELIPAEFGLSLFIATFITN